jgi:hypothetical protein
MEYEATPQKAVEWLGFQIRGWQFGDPARSIELALADGGVDIPLAAFKKFMVVTASF